MYIRRCILVIRPYPARWGSNGPTVLRIQVREETRVQEQRHRIRDGAGCIVAGEGPLAGDHVSLLNRRDLARWLIRPLLQWTHYAPCIMEIR